MIQHHPQHHFFYSTKINDSRFFSAFGTKELPLTNDNSRVQTLCKDLGIHVKGLYRSNQIHSTNIKVIKDVQSEATEEDGIITKEKNIAIILKTADCVPIIYVDKVTEIIAVSHQGWRGTYDEMSKVMIEELVKAGAKKESIQVAIGPAIGFCCFEVNEDLFTKFRSKFKRFDSITQERDGKFYVNLLELNFRLLEEAGLNKHQIDYAPFCTFCNKDQFFSYRRDYHTNHELFGQQLSFIIKQ